MDEKNANRQYINKNILIKIQKDDNMKIRNGFVSNSSSSSFLIAIKKEKNSPCDCCGRKDFSFDFLDLIRNSRDEETEVKANGKYIKDKISENTGQFETDILNSIEKHEKSDDCNEYELALLDISYSDYAILHIMDNMEKSGAIKVLIKAG